MWGREGQEGSEVNQSKRVPCRLMWRCWLKRRCPLHPAMVRRCHVPAGRCFRALCRPPLPPLVFLGRALLLSLAPWGSLFGVQLVKTSFPLFSHGRVREQLPVVQDRSGRRSTLAHTAHPHCALVIAWRSMGSCWDHFISLL